MATKNYNIRITGQISNPGNPASSATCPRFANAAAVDSLRTPTFGS